VPACRRRILTGSAPGPVRHRWIAPAVGPSAAGCLEALPGRDRTESRGLANGRGRVRRQHAAASMADALRAEVTAPGMGCAQGPAGNAQRCRAALVDRPSTAPADLVGRPRLAWPAPPDWSEPSPCTRGSSRCPECIPITGHQVGARRVSGSVLPAVSRCGKPRSRVRLVVYKGWGSAAKPPSPFWQRRQADVLVVACGIRLLPVRGGAIRPSRCGRGAPRPTARANAARRGRRSSGRHGHAPPHAGRRPPSDSGRRIR